MSILQHKSHFEAIIQAFFGLGSTFREKIKSGAFMSFFEARRDDIDRGERLGCRGKGREHALFFLGKLGCSMEMYT
jgi:hypothetical protein